MKLTIRVTGKLHILYGYSPMYERKRKGGPKAHNVLSSVFFSTRFTHQLRILRPIGEA